MSDRLREALERWDGAKEKANRSWQRQDIDRLAAVGRRWLALTETGPVEAESLLQSGWFVQVPKSGRYLVIPADYLTEEE